MRPELLSCRARGCEPQPTKRLNRREGAPELETAKAAAGLPLLSISLRAAGEFAAKRWVSSAHLAWAREPAPNEGGLQEKRWQCNRLSCSCA
jgi:hypothetical protein